MGNNTSSNLPEIWHYEQKDGYKIYQSGSHVKANFIRVFVPDNPYFNKQGKLKLITYLHGFALCMPQFYEAHLEVLAKRGYYIFFLDFQKSEYPNSRVAEKTQKANVEKPHFSLWVSRALKIATNKSSKFNKFQPESLFSSLEEQTSQEIPTIQGNLDEPKRFNYLRTSLAVATIILIVKLIYTWFNDTYGKNLIHLISTVGFSLAHQPSEWIKNAIALTEQSWQHLCKVNPQLAQQEFDFYVFGHSLGGLLALSWPIYITDENQKKFFPQQIITADPAPSTEMGIPRIAIWILKLFRSPFATAPINISDIGSQLNIPIGIMHGADDDIVKPQSWVKTSYWQPLSNFDYIASQEKKIYFSLSNQQHHPPLIAFHNQAVTDTTYYDDALFENFGGVKKGPNDYNNQYVWPGLSLVVEDQVRVDRLLGNFPLQTVQVTDILPDQGGDFKSIITVILAVSVVLALGYWLRFGSFLTSN
ncbi:hypothetical protein ACF3DV_06595 [Chlorogloeopsis fritschii PCC 9212]|uniref:Uncharacterized protein n=1 Tax=Chlorogloeopsis fritschii PCC 6912 TaxID=211165 RepID=A0A433N5Q3_CHLFR|nr:hypothetical protein [Chlorogloeopsis fritschii]RUR76777.1 hypothetical protein PCC6912_41810 [Chlorogloeopsis fritschii PCC 6912]